MIEDGAYTEDDLRRIGERWLARIREAEKREKDWIDNAEEAEAAYSADSEHSTDAQLHFNILHSNVETIVPSIFNSSPVPDIRPRHNLGDEVAKVVADILERALKTQIDDNAIDKEIEASAQDAFLAGRGIVRVRFDADEAEPVMDPMTGELVGGGLENERVLYEVVSWRDYREGPAKRWQDVPWVAYRHEISDDDRERLEDPELAAKQADDENPQEDLDCTVWEIWCKETRRVYFIVETTGKVLSITDDPLGLEGFFPQAAPVQPITLTGKRCPVCPYAVYKHLAKELDRATKRINGIMKGLKVRGLFAADATALDMLAAADDNEIVPLANTENLVAAGGLDKAVMWWPVEQAITVLRELYQQREATKVAIYEITGISDIIRGQGMASETATAQQIKTEWGALRIKKMQRLVERQVRDLFVLTSEVLCRHFSYRTLSMASGIQIDQQAMALLESPLKHYRIDVETDSTIRADLSRARGEMAQFLEGTAQFFASMQPVVAAAPESAGPLSKMYAAFARQFSLGKSAEDALEEFIAMAEQASQQQGENPEQQAMQAEMQAKMQELQLKAEEMQAKAQEGQAKIQLQQQEMQAEMQVKASELEIERDKLALDREKLELERAKIAQDMQMREREFAERAEDRETTRATAAMSAGVPPDFSYESYEADRQRIEQINEQIAALSEKIGQIGEIGEALQGNQAEMAEGIRVLGEQVFGPKEVIRDENGRPVGVRTARGEQMFERDEAGNILRMQ